MDGFVVTNGVIVYSRTVRPADFESKVSSVTLSFNIAEGSEVPAVLAKVSYMARQQVHAELGLAHTRGLPAEDRPEVVAPPTDIGEKRTRGPNKPKVVEIPPMPKVAENPLEGLVEDAPAREPAKPADASDDILSELDPSPAASIEPITDEHLKHALTVASERVKTRDGNIDAIRKLVIEFGGSWTKIDQGKRADFVADLKSV